MKLNGLTTAALLALVLLFSSSASASQFTFNDIVNSAPGKKSSAKGLRRVRRSRKSVRGGSGSGQALGGACRGPGCSGKLESGRSAKSAHQEDVTKKQFLVIAQAKGSGGKKAHPSSPQVIVDVAPKIPDCKPFDWLFIPHCADAAPRSDISLPKFNTVKLPRAYLHIFDLPYGWKNARIRFPSFGKCQSTRTAAMRAARPGDRLCRTAQFRITNRTNKRECKRVKYRSCSFWRCKNKYRTECKTRVITTYTECSRTYFVIRVFTISKQIPQVVATTGGIYSGYRSCNDAAAANYFTK